VAVVDRALCEAWLRLMADHSVLVHAADEDMITEQLRTELAAMRKANQPPGFNDALFGIPTRDSRLRDCHGESIDQSPDLTIYPAVSRPGIADDLHDALFFECKVLDKKRGMDLYRANGMERFTTGRYAWRMPHAGMLAYVLDKSECSPTVALTDYFARSTAVGSTIGKELGVSEPPIQVMKARNTLVSVVAETKHLRAAPVVNGARSIIALRHLWLLANPAS
jgi:hypothetical protein